MVSFLSEQRSWLVTGNAGFIGSHLVHKLLSHDQRVVGLDNFSTGFKKNIDASLSVLNENQRKLFSFMEGDIRSLETCKKAIQGIDVILHQAALGSVPRSIEDPLTTHDVNVNGFVNMLMCARDGGVKSFVYASSSSVYGDSPLLPKKEEITGNLLSPYALSKWTNELYTEVFSKTYGMFATGLRYFNIFGPRQNPEGPYAAVIPTWISALLGGREIYINGDGETSRDFTYIDNVVEANILAALRRPNPMHLHQVYNIGAGEQTTLNTLFNLIKKYAHTPHRKPLYRDFRPGDVRHSFANISKARKELGYEPLCTVEDGIQKIMEKGTPSSL